MSHLSVSSVEPLFAVVAGRPVCTRTWEDSADPKLSDGQIVDVGGTICTVIGKAPSANARFVTYQFSPADRIKSTSPQK